MIKRLDLGDFIREFEDFGRGDQFSKEALEILFNHLDELSEGDFELDVIAICCDYSELTKEAAIKQYGSLREIEDNTIIFQLDNGNILMANY